MSNSGTTRMPRSAAYAMIPRICAWVKYRPSDPFACSSGWVRLSMRKPWSSVRWRWRTFSLTTAIASRLRSITSTGCQWRQTSISRPRHGNRGASRIEAAGRHQPACSRRGSCRNVSSPRMAPTAVGARRTICVGATSSVYDSSSDKDGTAAPGPLQSIVSLTGASPAPPTRRDRHRAAARATAASSRASETPASVATRFPDTAMRPADTRASAGAGMTSSGWGAAPAGAVAAIEAAIALKRQIAEEFIGGKSLEGLDRLILGESQGVVGLGEPPAAVLGALPELAAVVAQEKRHVLLRLVAEDRAPAPEYLLGAEGHREIDLVRGPFRPGAPVKPELAFAHPRLPRRSRQRVVQGAQAEPVGPVRIVQVSRGEDEVGADAAQELPFAPPRLPRRSRQRVVQGAQAEPVGPVRIVQVSRGEDEVGADAAQEL